MLVKVNHRKPMGMTFDSVWQSKEAAEAMAYTLRTGGYVTKTISDAGSFFLYRALLKNTEKRYVFGNKHNKWYLVDETDRDFASGIPVYEFKKIGEAAAKERYLGPSIIGSGWHKQPEEHADAARKGVLRRRGY